MSNIAKVGKVALAGVVLIALTIGSARAEPRSIASGLPETHPVRMISATERDALILRARDAEVAPQSLIVRFAHWRARRAALRSATRAIEGNSRVIQRSNVGTERQLAGRALVDSLHVAHALSSARVSARRLRPPALEEYRHRLSEVDPALANAVSTLAIDRGLAERVARDQPFHWRDLELEGLVHLWAPERAPSDGWRVGESIATHLRRWSDSRHSFTVFAEIYGRAPGTDAARGTLLAVAARLDEDIDSLGETARSAVFRLIELEHGFGPLVTAAIDETLDSGWRAQSAGRRDVLWNIRGVLLPSYRLYRREPRRSPMTSDQASRYIRLDAFL